jgi:peptidoglycan/LPS O-acetylase OafA/YrhL
VALFFAISGFLICSRLLEEWRAKGTISLRAFYIRRAFRILPPALWYLFVVGLLAISGLISVSVREWIAALTFWRDYGFTPSFGWYTGHYWSLSVEEKFYLFWPALLVFVGSRRAFKFGALIALSVGLWRIADGHWRITQHAFDLPLSSLIFRWDTRLDALLYGCLLAIVLDAPAYRKWAIDHANQWVQLACIALVVGIVAEARIQPGIASVLEAMSIPLMIASTVLAPHTTLGRVLESRILVWVGRLSYSIYLWQQLFLDEVGRPLRILQSGRSRY